MAVLPPAPNTLSVVLTHLVGQDANAQDKFYLSYTGAAPTSAQCQSLASAVQSAWNTNLKPLMLIANKLQQITVTDLSTPTGGQGIVFPNSSGGRTGGYNTGETATLINFKLTRRYRGGHPRIYLPYGAASDISDPQTWVGSYLTAVSSGWQAFMTAVLGFAGPPSLGGQVNVSYHSGHTWVQNSITGNWKKVPTLRLSPLVEPIVGTSVNPKPASQRRRMLR
jgi:hypothetical protein